MTTTDQILQGIRTNREAVEANTAAREKATEALAAKVAETQKIENPMPEDPRPRIEREREDLQAAIAVGDADLSALAPFEREAEKAVKTYDAAARASKVPSHVQAAVQGLKRRIASLDSEISRLRADHDDLCRQLLLEQAEEAGRAYAAAGHEAFRAMCRAVALGSLHKRIGGENNIGSVMDAFCLPPLGVAATVTPGSGLSKRGSLFSLKTIADYIHLDAAEDEILAALRDAGVDLQLPAVPATPVVPRPPEPTESQVIRGGATPAPAPAPVAMSDVPEPGARPAAMQSEIWRSEDYPEDRSTVAADHDDGIPRDALGRRVRAVDEPDGAA